MSFNLVYVIDAPAFPEIWAFKATMSAAVANVDAAPVSTAVAATPAIISALLVTNWDAVPLNLV